ncbi:hypothetical protein C7974DRAFT_124249 [Boeremia exigua]|uniref:uncharacterized protein n=1 Tax=Boeremia exigua TaxID=749465 RepID=UPI001E8D3140|nr:uncharacterized protein C7974DRAFT_124249 [Boeremia exigua]KAH6638974.1 hypothetical protein C7974DRAFT_124249 [Boeremia exigua]
MALRRPSLPSVTLLTHTLIYTVSPLKRNGLAKMKSIVVGAMLLRTMNAQIPAGNAVPAVLPANPLNAVAPLITPGTAPTLPADLRSAIAAVASSLAKSSTQGSGVGSLAVAQDGVAAPVAGQGASLPQAAPLPQGVGSPVGSNLYSGPYDPNSIYDPTSPYYDPYSKPVGWGGDDHGSYEGEDDYTRPSKGPYYEDEDEPSYYDDEECPAWCLPKDDYEYKKEPEYEDGEEYYPEPEDKTYPQLKKVRSILRTVRRQVWGDDDESGQYDGEDGSIPDWLYDIDGAPKKPTKSKPKCPKSCYESKTKEYKPERPTYVKTRKGYTTTEDPYYTKTEDPYQTTEAPYDPTGAPYDGPYGGASGAWYPQSNSSTYHWPTSSDDFTSVPVTDDSSSEEPTPAPTESVPTESTPTDTESVPTETESIPTEPVTPAGEPTDEATAPYEPTTFVTQYQSQPSADSYDSSSSDPGSPAGDYTGETLDTICPNTCNPFNPAENFCDITTGCTTTGGSKFYCACRAGYRADGYNAKDFSKQFKVPGQPYVYLAVTTTCGTLCSDSTCSEVMERPHCK